MMRRDRVPKPDRAAARPEPDRSGAESQPQETLQRAFGNTAIARAAQAAAPLAAPAARPGRAAALKHIVQRTLGSNPVVANGTPVVHHGLDADEDGFVIESYNPMNTRYTIRKLADNTTQAIPARDISWGTVDNRAASRAAFLEAKFDWKALATAPANVPRSDFRYWFHYMLQQIDGMDAKLPFIRRVYEASPGQVVRGGLNDAQKRQILTDMFQIGFANFVELEQAMQQHVDPTIRLVKTGAELVPQNAIAGSNFGFGFRGDSRETEVLKGHGGFGTKIDNADQTWRNNNGLNADWNPFKFPDQLPGWVNGGYNGFYRKSDKDNDLTTVVSVARNFFDATKFPMIEEGYVPVSQVDVNGAMKKKTTIYVYMLLVEQGFDTARAQGSNAFPEFGTRSIPWHNHLAVFKVDRIHHGDTANQGHIVNVVETKVGRVAKERYGQSPMWAAMMQRVRQFSGIRNHDYAAEGAAV